MDYKLAELRRAYYIWSAKMQQKMNVIQWKLQQWTDDVSQRAAEWWQTVSYTYWPSVSHLQHHFQAAKMTLLGVYTR